MVRIVRVCRGFVCRGAVVSDEKPKRVGDDAVPERYRWPSGRPMRCFKIADRGGVRFVSFVDYNAHQRAKGLPEALE